MPVKRENPNKKIFYRGVFRMVTIIFALALAFSFIYEAREKPAVINITDLAGRITAGEVSKIAVSGDNLEVELKSGERLISKKEAEAGLTQTLVNYGVNPDQLKSVGIESKEQSGVGFWASIIIPALLPLILIGAIFYFLIRQARTGVNQAFTFGRANVRLAAGQKEKITFADVAGLKEAKKELEEIVDFLKEPKKYIEMGAKIPRGVLLMGPPGTGKCITGESLVLTNKGLLPIADIPKYFTVDEDGRVVGAKVLTFNQGSRSFEWQEPSHWFNLGHESTIRIETQLGTAIEGTPEHPIVVLEKTGQLKFKNIAEIQIGEKVAVTYGHQAFGSYKKIPSEEIAYLLGLLTGDGGLTTRGRVVFSSSDRELVTKFKEAVKNTWQREPSQKNQYDYWLSDLAVKKDLIGYGLKEVYAENKAVPETVLLGARSIVTAFLRGLFDTDGYCGKGGVELSSASKELIFTAHHLLLNLGIVNRIDYRRKKLNGKLQHYLAISGDFLAAFNNEIGFGLKRKQLLMEKLLAKKRNTNNNLIYYQAESFGSIWRTIKTSGFRASREFYRQSFYKNLARYINGERNPSIVSLTKTLEFFEKAEPAIVHHPVFQSLSSLSQSPKLFFSAVTKTAGGEAEVFDFTVPGNHSFVANGLINHNTLLARAVAGEAGVPFFHISASEFVEMFVGVGAARIRDSFQTAKKAAPAILFIDEIDAVGRERGAGLGGGHDEREQTLNQILVEMDGFDQNTNTIVISATNRPDVLDQALLRPGRFDRRVILDLPDIKEREEILKIHAKNKPLVKDVDFAKIAARTPGFSGADLANLVNEAAILAVQEKQKKISQLQIYESIEKVVLGPARRSRLVSEKEKKITAYHEAGHALVSAGLKDADPVNKVSIVARGRAGGYTLNLPTEDRRLKTKSQFLADLAVMLGGYASEEIVFKDVSTGASNDLKEVSSLARQLVTRYGMSESLGPLTFGKTEELIFLGREITTEKNYSETVATKIDAEVRNFIDRGHKKAKQIINGNKDALKAVAKALMEKEVLEQEEFYALIKPFKLRPVKA